MLEILPHQPYTRLLNGKYTKNMLDVACKRPHENLFLILNEGIPKINLQQLVSLACSSRNPKAHGMGELASASGPGC
jgi:hypothetical protein